MKNIILSLLVIPLTACASIVTGSSQTVSVDTTPIGAECDLTNEKGTWNLNDTPGTVMVKRAHSDLHVKCQKGSLVGTKTVASSTKAVAFGNVVFGGVIGAGVDMSTGAAYDYPSTIQVKLK
jgi:uncharacterized protein YceK